MVSAETTVRHPKQSWVSVPSYDTDAPAAGCGRCRRKLTS